MPDKTAGRQRERKLRMKIEHKFEYAFFNAAATAGIVRGIRPGIQFVFRDFCAHAYSEKIWSILLFFKVCFRDREHKNFGEQAPRLRCGQREFAGKECGREGREWSGMLQSGKSGNRISAGRCRWQSSRE